MLTKAELLEAVSYKIRCRGKLCSLKAQQVSKPMGVNNQDNLHLDSICPPFHMVN